MHFILALWNNAFCVKAIISTKANSFNQQWAECSSVAAGYSKEKAKQTAGLCNASFGNEGINPIKDVHIFYLNFQKVHRRAQTAFRVPYPGKEANFMIGTTSWARNVWSCRTDHITAKISLRETPKMVSTLVLLQIPPCEALSNNTVIVSFETQLSQSQMCTLKTKEGKSWLDKWFR